MDADRLATYRAKRDFQRTPEPAGRAGLPPGRYPRFVVQRHAARRLHYDLRLEIDGVYKSWAVTRGPSLDPTDKRLAVEVEDHPLDYGDFEGTIPKGEYGGGTVMLWDRGYWLPQDNRPASQALRDGELKLVLAGEKLEGGWILVRMQSDREQRGRINWLLIKHRDQWARPGDADALLRKDRSVATGRTMRQITAGGERYHGSPDHVANALPAAAPHSRPLPQRSQAKHSNAVLGVAISNPHKLLWPEDHGDPVTKFDLARYLEAVGAWMIGHIAGRPCSIVRAPNGLGHPTFFQRHVPVRMSRHLVATQVADEPKPYLQIDKVEGLIAVAQLAAVELHPWNCAPQRPDAPGRLVFDLDPAENVAFDEVVTAALTLRERLEALGLRTFCKTTGGKGLHVVTPLRADKRQTIGWDEAKAFARSVCVAMAQDQPDRYLVKMTKRLRTGRIFLDYLRNDRTATAVAPLSPRLRPGAPVSMPLDWRQVRRGLDPLRFTIRTAPRLLARGSPWSDYGDGARPLVDAIKRHMSA